MADRAKAGFNLFGAEERELERAEVLTARLADAPDEVKNGVAALTEAYRKAVREQRRLVRVSDRQQAQLATLNQELARRSAEAEDALERLREAQDTLIQAEKLASLGALVAGVAHEINTPVGIALSCASHLADSTEGIRRLFTANDIGINDFERYMATATDTAGLIQTNCERAAALIGSFKQVAVDRTSEERRHFDLATTINETIVSLSPKLRESGHRIFVDCPSGLTVDGFPGAFTQILTNLVMNSVIHGYDPNVTGLFIVTVDTPAPGNVRMVFRDDGKGIAEEHLSRIFDPFFTTRRGAGGSGLGLNTVYNLVTGPLGGTVGVTSAPNQGTAFTVTFPQTAKAAAEKG